jgi:hypothetical protein
MTDNKKKRGKCPAQEQLEQLQRIFGTDLENLQVEEHSE